jgi:hypothetical protein
MELSDTRVGVTFDVQPQPMQPSRPTQMPRQAPHNNWSKRDLPHVTAHFSAVADGGAAFHLFSTDVQYRPVLSEHL